MLLFESKQDHCEKQTSLSPTTKPAPHMPENGNRPLNDDHNQKINNQTTAASKSHLGNPVERFIELVLPDLGLKPLPGLIPLVRPQHLHILGARHARQPPKRPPLAALQRHRISRRRPLSHLGVVHGAQLQPRCPPLRNDRLALVRSAEPLLVVSAPLSIPHRFPVEQDQFPQIRHAQLSGNVDVIRFFSRFVRFVSDVAAHHYTALLGLRVGGGEVVEGLVLVQVFVLVVKQLTMRPVRHVLQVSVWFGLVSLQFDRKRRWGAGFEERGERRRQPDFVVR